MAGETKASVNLVVGANADVLNAVLDQAQKRANSFSTNLAKAAALGAAAFVSLKEGVFGTVEAFAESEAASNRLRASLLTQGLLSNDLVEQYDTLANKLSELTGADDDAIKSMMAAGQAMLGTIQMTEPLTKAIADLAAGTGMDLGDAFEKVTKTIGSHTNALAKNGFHIDENLSRNEKLSEVIRQIEGRYNDQAKASQNVGTSIASLGVQFGNLREAIGARFAPVVEAVTKSLTSLFSALANSPALLDFISGVALATTTVLGLVSGFLALKAAVSTLAPVFAVLSGPLGIVVGALVAASGAAVLLYRHFDEIKIAFKSFASEIVVLGFSIGQVLAGIFTGNIGKVSEGVQGLRAAFQGGLQKMQADLAAHKAEETKIEDAANKAKNDANRQAKQAEIAEENAHFSRLDQIEANKTEIIQMHTKRASKLRIELKNEENSILQQIDKAYGDSETGRDQKRIDALNEQLEQNRKLQAMSLDDIKAYKERLDAVERNDEEIRKASHYQASAEFIALKTKENELLTELNDARDKESIDRINREIENTHAAAEAIRAIEEGKHQAQVAAAQEKAAIDLKYLDDKKRFGETYAKLNRTMHSEEVENFRDGANQLSALSQSKHQSLKSIAKAATVSQIAMSTAEAAMSAYKSLAGIPIVGPGLGIAAAAAAVAFGAERTQQALAANQGGLVPGGGPNLDSVPALLTPGELVVPRQNFNEVVGAVKSDRGGNGDVVLELQALRSDLQGARPNVVIHGDMMSDDSFVDRMIQRISDRLEFGNAKLSGVNA